MEERRHHGRRIAEAGVLCARTDVGGAYRDDPKNRRWIPTTDFISHEDANHKSDDGGEKFVRINDDTHQYGRGIVYGEPKVE